MEGFLSVPIGCSAVVKGEEGSKNPDFCVDVICKRPHFELKQQKLCVGFLLTNRQFQGVGHCRRHIFALVLPKFCVEFENMNSSCDNLRPFGI